MTVIDIGLFAHNEAGGIRQMLKECHAQSLLWRDDVDVRLLVLANGCRDETVRLAREEIAALGFRRAELIDLAEGGKSRTWNRYVHELARGDADFLLFCDADIQIPDKDGLSRLVDQIAMRADVAALSSKPVKDLALSKRTLSPTEKMILASGGGLDDWKKAICGQLYIGRAAVMRQIWLPVGLPVEDGFVRAMILTDNLRQAEDLSKIDGGEGCEHIYESERTISALIRHQVRIVIGGAINLLIFRCLREVPNEDRGAFMARCAGRNDWLPQLIAARLPRFPYGWVPGHFWFKRWSSFRKSGGKTSPKRWLVLVLGLGFDTVVYAIAQLKMARGVGANHW